MILSRAIVLLLLIAAILCFAAYIGTGAIVWRNRGIVIVKWTVIAGLAFFAVLLLERVVPML